MRPLALEPGLFPPRVAVRGLRLESSVDTLLEHLDRFDGIALPEALRSAVPKRRLEYLAGRHCARAALRECAPGLAEHGVGTGPNREPLWPAGAVGSIAHTTGYVVSVATSHPPILALGVDVERWMDPAAPQRIGAHIAARGELDALAARTGWSLARLLTLVFSAKESIFKCLYPEVQRYFGFQDARVQAIDPQEGTFVATLTAPLAHLPSGLELHGRFTLLDEVVVTALVRWGPVVLTETG